MHPIQHSGFCIILDLTKQVTIDSALKMRVALHLSRCQTLRIVKVEFQGAMQQGDLQIGHRRELRNEHPAGLPVAPHALGLLVGVGLGQPHAHSPVVNALP